MMGPQVGEMIGEVCVLMAFGGASEDLARTCHPHPTRSEAVRQAAMGVENWTMQMYSEWGVGSHSSQELYSCIAKPQKP
jgi:hypothetical protein